MTNSQVEDFITNLHLEEAPVWEAEEKQRISKERGKNLNDLQDLQELIDLHPDK